MSPVCVQILEEGENEWRSVSNPASIPDGRVKYKEPFATVDVICNQEHVGAMMELAIGRRGIFENQRQLGMDRVKIVFSLPLAELVTDFHDAVKSRSAGYASVNYDLSDMRDSKLIRMDVHVAGDLVEGYVTKFGEAIDNFDMASQFYTCASSFSHFGRDVCIRYVC